nr:hypothetical protein [Tanacetum cinerariifolium]
MDRDHSDQLQADLAEARKKRRKRLDSPRNPSVSPPASGASGSSQLPPHPPSPSKPTNSNKSKQQKNDSGASDSTKLHVVTHQSSAWKISVTRDKPSGSSVHHLSPPEDQQMNDDLVPSDEVHTSGDDDLGTVLKVLSHKYWWKPRDDDERLATLEPAWVIPTSHIHDDVKNQAKALATMYQALAENSLPEKTMDMRMFMKWYFQEVGKTKLTQADFKGQANKVLKAFYLDVIHLQIQMEECHKMLTNQIDWANP